MYEFHRGESAEEDFCYIRFEEGNWYTIYGVPTTFTNGISGSIYPEMAEEPMKQTTEIYLQHIIMQNMATSIQKMTG